VPKLAICDENGAIEGKFFLKEM
ncbi:uncharacterized protein METZ01_LOCUS112420, partial [marine metagenome]